MILKNIKLRNFRSYGGKETVINLQEDMNVFVGENNSGKSNIFLALKKLKLYLENNGNYYPKNSPTPHPVFTKSDWHLEQLDTEMNIEVSLILNDVEKESLLKQIIGAFILSKEKKNELREELDNELTIIFQNKYHVNLSSPFFRWGNFYITFDSVLSIELPISKYKPLKLQQIVSYCQANNISFYESFKSHLNSPYMGINTSGDIYNIISKIFYENFKIFEDIRQNPDSEKINVNESLDGVSTAAILFNLKNGDIRQRKIYNIIQKEFEKYFPQLSFEIIEKYKKIHIMIRSKKWEKYEHFLNQAGTGIMEFLIVLVNLIGSKNKVFVFEEPELHLHPSAQRSLSKLIYEHSNNNQIIIITHSPVFVDSKNITKNTIVRHFDGKNRISQISDGIFDLIEISKIYKELNGSNKELFFSRAVLLVEGETELGALPVFADKLGNNFDANNVFVCFIGGKGAFPFYQKILNNLDIPYAILCDEDAGSKKNIVDYDKKIILDLDFEGYIKKEGFELLYAKSKEILGDSKPRRGRYVAEKIPKEKIPQKFVDVINMVVLLATTE